MFANCWWNRHKPFNDHENILAQYLWLYGQGLGHVPSRFERLMNFVGSDVMRPIYGFIIYAETAQTERLESARAKRDSKKKKKDAPAPKMLATGKVIISNRQNFSQVGCSI